MKKIFLIIGFLFLISCSSKEEQASEKSQPQKEQEAPALNLRPIEDLGTQESQDVSKHSRGLNAKPRPSDSAFNARYEIAYKRLKNGESIGNIERSEGYGTTPEYKALIQMDLDRIDSIVRAMPK